jgi:hypothetical protein
MRILPKSRKPVLLITQGDHGLDDNLLFRNLLSAESAIYCFYQ